MALTFEIFIEIFMSQILLPYPPFPLKNQQIFKNDYHPFWPKINPKNKIKNRLFFGPSIFRSEWIESFFKTSSIFGTIFFALHHFVSTIYSAPFIFSTIFLLIFMDIFLIYFYCPLSKNYIFVLIFPLQSHLNF